jgi:hypothetical protein
MKVRALVCAIAFATIPAGVSASGLGGLSGAFSRLGFAARGIGMGNAQTAVATGDVTSYYNPALIPFAGYRFASATAGILSLDRSLNFLGYSQPLPPRAGISFGLINSGISAIDGRDEDGEQTGPLKTSENQLFFSFGIRPGERVAIGVSIKYYQNHLYTDVNASTVGIDFGVLVLVTDALAVGATAKDVNSQYTWDTSQLYGQDGARTAASFPKLYTIGLAYKVLDSLALLAGDLEFSSAKTAIVRCGLEVPLVPEVTVRAGIDRIDLKEKGSGVRPSFGLTLNHRFEDWNPSIVYAYVVEPFSPSGMHFVSLSVGF